MKSIIHVEHLKKYYNDVKAVDDISFDVEEGEMFGFLGVNGAGKSTTIHMLCTLLAPTDGNIEIAGNVVGTDDNQIKKSIGIVYQANCLDEMLTVKENLMIRGSLYENEKSKIVDHLDWVTQTLELEDILKRPFGKLSGGQKRRCEIARALMNRPKILFLDEPTTGLDPATRKSVWQSIGKLRKDSNMTVFLTTHYMEEAAKASHIAIMDHGKLVQYGTPFTLKEEFAGDKLRLVPKDSDSLIMELDKRNIQFHRHNEFISIRIKDTMQAIPMVNEFKDLLCGFEVIQGTMDDVFLNVTGKEVVENA